MLNSLSYLKQALRTTPLRLMVLTQALAISALLTVLLTADRYQQYFIQEAAQLLGGDIVLSADRNPPAQLAQLATQAGLRSTRTVQFASVVVTGEAQTLVSVKAVSDGYPLRGKVTFKPNMSPQGLQTEQAPQRGTVWVDPALLASMNLAYGANVSLGQREFKIAGVIELEPDRGVQFGSFAPRVMLHEADLESTQLLGAGSRASYRMQFSGQARAVVNFKEVLTRNLQAGQRLETLDEGRPEMRTTLERASKFLGLVAILTTLIAACGLGLVAQVWAAEQTSWVALMRTFGASTPTIAGRMFATLAWVSALGLSLGILAGYGLQTLLSYFIQMQEGLILPHASFTPLLQSVVLLLVLVATCIVPPTQKLLRTRPMAILRPSEQKSGLRTPWWMYGLALLSLSVLFMWVAGSMLVGLYILLGLVGVIGLLGVCLWGLMRLTLRFGRTSNVWLVRTASRGLLRNPLMTLIQASTLTLALLGLLTMGVLQKDVLGAWQNVLPKDAPNHFILNVQPDQSQQVAAYLSAAGVSQVNMMPMIRARLIAVNNTPIGPADFEGERAKRLVDREFNMSYLAQLPAGNSVVQGQWHGQASGAVSMEEGIMQTLKLKLGDSLRFDVAGQTVDLKIGSVRKLRWESLNVNFFAISSVQDALNLPQTFITAVRVPKGVNLTSMVKQFPNLTVLDVGMIAAQAQGVLDKVTQALQLLFGMAVLAGVLVVAVSSYASRVVRLKESVLLRVLGASSAQVRWAQLLELAGIGGLAGMLAGGVSYGLVWGMAQWVLELPVALNPWPVYVGAVLGAVLSVSGGLLVLFGIERTGLAQRLRVLS